MKPLMCKRNKHMLVRAVVVDGEPAIEARTAIVSAAGIRTRLQTFTAEELAEFEGLGIMVSCPCGRLYSVDLIAWRRGQTVPLRPMGPGTDGVSHDRSTTTQ